MLVKINSRGSGGGRGPTEYLTGNKDHAGTKREVAPEVLRGDPIQTRDLIDSLGFKQRYTSGSLNFSEPDLAPGQKAEIMDSWENCLFPGMEKNQYQVLWVEHRDKGRLELNFVIPNVELQSGKRLHPYYDKADRPRVDAWQTLVNDKYKLTDPHDPARARTMTTPSNLPQKRQEAAQAITEGLLTLEPQNRSEVVTALSEAGFTVTRQTKKSISIADPEGGKPLRLSGGIYDQSYRGGEELLSQRQAAEASYREGRAARISEASSRYRAGIEIRRQDLKKRYPVERLETLSLEELSSASTRRRVRRGLRVDGLPVERPEFHDSKNLQERPWHLDTMPETLERREILPNQGSQVDDRIRADLAESVEAAGRSAGRIERESRKAAAADRPTGRISQAVGWLSAQCDRVIQRCRVATEQVREALKRHEPPRSRGPSFEP